MISCHALRVARRRGLSEHDGEEFKAWLLLKLVDRDYAVIRAFQGEGSFSAYLRRVVTNGFKDFCDHCWGKWRVSAASRHHPSPALSFLELLYCRDGVPLEQALRMVLQRHGRSVDENELRCFAADISPHPPRRTVSYECLPEASSRLSAAQDLTERERRTTLRRLRGALRRVWRSMPETDSRLLELYYLHGKTIAQIAVELDLPQRPLYRRRDQALAELRSRLESSGLEKGEIVTLFGWQGLELAMEGITLEGIDLANGRSAHSRMTRQ